MFVFAIWIFLFFVGIPPHQTIMRTITDQATSIFSVENPARLTFVWLAALPFITASISSVYLLKLARSKFIAILLLVLTIGSGLVVLAFGPLSLAIFVLLPAFWGWKCLEEIQENHQTEV
jgi:hypothetical protein